MSEKMPTCTESEVTYIAIEDNLRVQELIRGIFKREDREDNLKIASNAEDADGQIQETTGNIFLLLDGDFPKTSGGSEVESAGAQLIRNLSEEIRNRIVLVIGWSANENSCEEMRASLKEADINHGVYQKPSGIMRIVDHLSEVDGSHQSDELPTAA